MEHEDVKAIAKQAATEALNEFMLILGVNLDNKDNMLLLNKDLTYLRGMREGRSDLAHKGLVALLGAAATAVVAFIVNHFRT